MYDDGMSLHDWSCCCCCALNRDTFCPDSSVDVCCGCGFFPDDSRTEACTVGGCAGLVDGGGGRKDGESMTVTDASPPSGAKDGESTIMGGGWDAAGREPTAPTWDEADVDEAVAWDEMDGRGGRAAMRSTTVELVGGGLAGSAPPSRGPSSSARVGGGAAREGLNLEPFWEEIGAGFGALGTCTGSAAAMATGAGGG
jgi:hypothetical protein